MKAVLEFDLPEDTEEFEVYRQAYKYHTALTGVRDLLRSARKYETIKTLQEFEEKFFEIVRDEEIEGI